MAPQLQLLDDSSDEYLSESPPKTPTTQRSIPLRLSVQGSRFRQPLDISPLRFRQPLDASLVGPSTEENPTPSIEDHSQDAEISSQSRTNTYRLRQPVDGSPLRFRQRLDILPVGLSPEEVLRLSVENNSQDAEMSGPSQLSVENHSQDEQLSSLSQTASQGTITDQDPSPTEPAYEEDQIGYSTTIEVASEVRFADYFADYNS